MSTIECNVCCVEVKNIAKNVIKCGCGFKVCKDCSKRYLLDTIKEAHCMNCKVGWSTKFLINNFGASWVEGNKEGQYRHRRKIVALDREKARLPETLAQLAQIREERKVREEINKIREERQKQYNMIRQQIRHLRHINPNTITLRIVEYTRSMDHFPVGHGISKEWAKFLLSYRKAVLPEDMYIRTTKCKNPVFRPGNAHKDWVICGIYMGPKKHLPSIEWMAKKSPVPKRIANISDQISRLTIELNDFWNGAYDELYANVEVPENKETKITFLCPCPRDGCKGMIDSRKFACVKCEKKICKSCREIKDKDDDHECDPKIVENVKFLKVDTKPCPSCAFAIHKINGCSQMWCPGCHTAFDWKTGAVDTGIIHNPHAIQWRREHGGLDRDINDIPCGGLIDINRIGISRTIDDQSWLQYESIYRLIAEISFAPSINVFDQLRLEYVEDHISEDVWKQTIFRIGRTNARRKVISDIKVTLRTLAIERFRDLYETLRENTAQNEVLANFFYQMEEIRVFINNAFLSELPPLGTTHPDTILDTEQYGWIWASRYRSYVARNNNE